MFQLAAASLWLSAILAGRLVQLFSYAKILVSWVGLVVIGQRKSTSKFAGD